MPTEQGCALACRQHRVLLDVRSHQLQEDVEIGRQHTEVLVVTLWVSAELLDQSGELALLLTDCQHWPNPQAAPFALSSSSPLSQESKKFDKLHNSGDCSGLSCVVTGLINRVPELNV